MTELSNKIFKITKDKETAQSVLIAIRNAIPIPNPTAMHISEYTGGLRQFNDTSYVIHDALKDLRSDKDIQWEKDNLIQGYKLNV